MYLTSSVLLPEQFRAEGSLPQQFFAGLNQGTQLNLERRETLMFTLISQLEPFRNNRHSLGKDTYGLTR